MKDSTDYRKKYQDLRGRFISSMDVAFRMGYEKGVGDARQEQAAIQMQQAQQMQAQAQQMQANAAAAQSQDSPSQDGEMQPVEQQPEELDQAISELEGLVNKSEFSADDIKKSIEKIKNYQTFKKMNFPSMKKAMSTSLPPLASANLTAAAKKELSMQEKIIDDIMNKWDQEAPKATSEALRVLGTEVLTKKE